MSGSVMILVHRGTAVRASESTHPASSVESAGGGGGSAYRTMRPYRPRWYAISNARARSADASGVGARRGIGMVGSLSRTVQGYTWQYGRRSARLTKP